MPSLAFRKASICSRFSFSASCTLVVNPQHATRSRLILYWKLPPPSGSSCIGKDCGAQETGWIVILNDHGNREEHCGDRQGDERYLQGNVQSDHGRELS